jgi:hypothetical protein
LSERVERMEALLQERREALGPEAQAAISELRTEGDQAIISDSGKAHLSVVGTMEWARPFWVTRCGWRFGLNCAVRVIAADRADAVRGNRCARCWRNVPSAPVGQVG